jgi:membrane-bound lytic murein transglycosylase D
LTIRQTLGAVFDPVTTGYNRAKTFCFKGTDMMRIAIIYMIFFCDSGFAVASRPMTSSYSNSIDEVFPKDEFVARQVKFWEAIFRKFNTNQTVIHDLDDPSILVDVIDFKNFTLSDGSTTLVEDVEQPETLRRYVRRYELAVERFSKYREKALQFGPIEQRVYDVYARSKFSLARLYRGDIKLRAQSGLSDTFLSAAKRAQEYLPYMERVFKEAGLPVELTRLPFVESMFNIRAKSKVGAAGLWQFMPATAKSYMTVGSFVDERYSPYKATRAAAQFMAANYRDLKSWPTAITAYNHGAAGMRRATRQLGTNEMGHIIRKYQSPTFGFASKNFYAEFLAAVSTYEYLKTSLPLRTPDTTVVATVLERPTALNDILRRTGLDFDSLQKLNPCLQASVLGRSSNPTLPSRYEIRLPRAAAYALKTSPSAKISRR